MFGQFQCSSENRLYAFWVAEFEFLTTIFIWINNYKLGFAQIQLNRIII